MLPLNGKHGVVISRVPVMQNGLGGVMTRHFPDFEITYCRSMQELTLLQLRRAGVVIADISGEYRNPRGTLEQYYGLMNQYRDIHWIFLVSRPLYPLAVELLMRPESTLLNKSNKTISAQKNSAMRRLSLRSNADMYAWISSTQGMRELSLMSAYGEFEEWKRPLQQDISPSSKAAQ